MYCSKLALKLLVKKIARANEYEVNEIIKALICWQGRVFPEYELIILSLPKYGREERERQIMRIMEFLREAAYPV